MPLVHQTPQWQALERHYQEIKDLHLRDLFAADPERAQSMTLDAAGLHLDYSKNRITRETLGLLFDLAGAVDLPGWIRRMYAGDTINNTEQRAVLHVALRNRSNRTIYVDGADVMPAINAVLTKMQGFTERVRSGEWVGHTGERITDVVNIGIGGSNLGPKMICAALGPYLRDTLRVHFVSNVDGTHLAETIRALDPASTLFVVASKTFTTQET
jgi:glucose-6-phosphate isomerase